MTVGVHPDHHSLWVFGRRAMTFGDQFSLNSSRLSLGHYSRFLMLEIN